jgi:outer membrane protein TolC
MKYSLLIAGFLLIAGEIVAQSPADSLSLEQCYQILYRENPVTDKIRTNREITSLNQRIAVSGWYPDFQLNASASYQSDVVNFPFDAPGIETPSFSKDHYNLNLNIAQPLYDGGRTRAAKHLENDTGEVTEASLELDLLRLKEEVDRIYFGILILQKQREITETVLTDLNEQLEVVRSRVENGVLLPGNESALRAEILNRRQQETDIRYNIMAGYEALNEILGNEIVSTQPLMLPDKENWRQSDPMAVRPELTILNARDELFQTQKAVADAGKLPQISLFARPSYGRPGLNIFDDNLQFNWIVGVEARWSLKTARNASIKTEVLHLLQQNVTYDRTLFEQKQNAALSRLLREIEAIDEQVERDREIVELRQEVAEEKQKLVDQGSATVTEYIAELNQQIRAQLQLELRKIQRIQTIINYESEQGWSWN